MLNFNVADPDRAAIYKQICSFKNFLMTFSVKTEGRTSIRVGTGHFDPNLANLLKFNSGQIV